jgi:DNA polymerase III subunit delta
MAGRTRSNAPAAKTPGFQDLLRQDLKSGNLRPVYVLDGPDQLRIEQVVAAIKKLALDPAAAAFNEHVIDAEAVGWSGIIQQASGYPMLGERQLVWARHADRIKTGSGKSDPGEAALSSYLQAPLDSTILIITGEKFHGAKAWIKAARKSGFYFSFAAPTGAELRTWIDKAAARAGLTLPSPAVELLAELVGGDLQALQGEIEKLALLEASRGQALDPDELPALVMDQAQLVVFDLTDAAGPGRGPAMLGAWFDLIAWGSSVEELSPILVTHLRRAALVAACLADDLHLDALQGATGLNAWMLRNKLAPLARRLDGAGWRRVLKQCLEYDDSVKRRPIPPHLASEQLLIGFHGATGKA